ncbi:MAG: PQQ-binding-like beta-propeller repeat protein [Candidatus Kaiserbacteria bacterium]|nr:MAG: PQQ-binding-like beta-propeller repeat protein [Candidatus Kaiserbacteria bacterium]
MDGIEEHKAHLKELIENSAYVRAEHENIVSSRKKLKESGWLFDLRRILLRSDALEDIAEIFWDTFRERFPFQIGGIETAAITLVTALTVHAGEVSKKKTSGFFIRKSRKKDGLMRAIEGEIAPGAPIILVDDLINSGKSIERQVEVLEALGHRVQAVWTLIRFRDLEHYEYLRKKNIELFSVFTLDDFSETLGVSNLTHKEPVHSRPFMVRWKFAAKNPSFFYVVPKSEPAIDDTHVYVGSDDGTMWAIRQDTGQVAWSYRILLHMKGKGIFSSPALLGESVFFGGYDGNFYALDRTSGKRKWVFLEADWIGSSPAVAVDLNLVFVGLEFGLWRKRGGVVALDAHSGKKIWEYREMPCYTHSSPLYLKDTREVIVGSNDGAAYLLDAKTGALKWKFSPAEPSDAELDVGFSSNDIKESFAYDRNHDRVIFGSTAGTLYFVDRRTGTEAGRFQAEYGFYATPALYENTAIIGSLDKNLYCVDLSSFQEVWRWSSGARIFASPKIIGDSVFIGSNTGRLTEIDARTGKEQASITLTERITNKIAYNAETSRFFVPTFANEIYCVEKDEKKA